MWERRKRTPQKRIDSLIGVGTVVYGNVAFTGGLRIDGQVQGNVEMWIGGQVAAAVGLHELDDALGNLADHARLFGHGNEQVGADQLAAASPTLLPLNKEAEEKRATSVEEQYGKVAPGVVLTVKKPV